MEYELCSKSLSRLRAILTICTIGRGISLGLHDGLTTDMIKPPRHGKYRCDMLAYLVKVKAQVEASKTGYRWWKYGIVPRQATCDLSL